MLWLNSHIFGKVTKNMELFEHSKGKNKNL